MSIQIDSDVFGLYELEEKMARLDTQLFLEIQDTLQGEANLIASRAQFYAPIRTGFLRSTIYAVVTAFLHFKVGAWCYYAKFQEFGTRYIPAQRFLSRAFQEQWPRLKSRVDYIVRKVILEVGRT
jgi:HK97 gp10 family phage protein